MIISNKINKTRKQSGKWKGKKIVFERKHSTYHVEKDSKDVRPRSRDETYEKRCNLVQN